MFSLIPRIIWPGNETEWFRSWFLKLQLLWLLNLLKTCCGWWSVTRLSPSSETLLSTWWLLPHQSTHTSCTIVQKMVEWVDKCVYSCTLRIIASYLKVLWPRLHILYIAARWSASMLHAGNKGFIEVKEWPSSEPKCLEILTQFCFYVHDVCIGWWACSYLETTRLTS